MKAICRSGLARAWKSRATGYTPKGEWHLSPELTWPRNGYAGWPAAIAINAEGVADVRRRRQILRHLRAMIMILLCVPNKRGARHPVGVVLVADPQLREHYFGLY
jgi:hypothetical protein